MIGGIISVIAAIFSFVNAMFGAHRDKVMRESGENEQAAVDLRGTVSLQSKTQERVTAAEGSADAIRAKGSDNAEKVAALAPVKDDEAKRAAFAALYESINGKYGR